MKVSVNWMQFLSDQYGNGVRLMPSGIDELVQKIGAQLGAVEEVIDLGEKYKGIVIAKVVSCEKHPDADRLHVCTIDDGRKVSGVDRDNDGNVQVVCGAPNVREGLTVAWLPPGVTVPSTFDKKPFVMESREIRSVISNGMLASPQELAISENHDGIAELDEGRPGDDFSKVFKLNDYIIDIENKMFTHRPDCFGQLGVAREVAGIRQQAYRSPEWYLNVDDSAIKPGKEQLTLEIKNDLPDLIPRFTAIALSEIEVKQSPFWLQTYLSRVGIRPINNIVDLTNFYMMQTGQPLHAYDYDKLPSKSLETRLSRKGDKLKLLGGKELELLDEKTMLVTSGDVPVGVGGIMGGADTEIDENTKNIVLECANWDMYTIRRSVMRYGLFTDAATRFTKGQSPFQTDRVIAKTADDIWNLAHGKVSSKLFDIFPKESKAKANKAVAIPVSRKFINDRLGLDLTVKDIEELLKNVEFQVKTGGDNLYVDPPFWRTDIEIPEDIVEEVGRLYGYDHLPLELPSRIIMPAVRNTLLDFKSRVRDVLSKAGANEVLTYSFIHGNLLDKAGQDKEKAFRVANAISPDLQYFRLSLTPSLLEKVHPNIKSGHDEFGLFEIGKSHSKGLLDDEGLPREFNRIAFVFAADQKSASQKYAGAAYYQAQKFFKVLLDEFGLSDTISLHPLASSDFGEHFLIEQMTQPFDPDRSAVVIYEGHIVGVVGEYKAGVKSALKLPEFSSGFEIFHSFMMNDPASDRYAPLSRFPKVQQDMTLKVNADVTYQALHSELENSLLELTDDNLQARLEPLDIYQKSDEKHFTFRLTASHYEKTLKAAEINNLLDKLAERANQKFGAVRI